MAFPTIPGRPRRARAFTLIELLVVMVIIASLLSIAVPRYFKSIDHSKEVVLAQDLAVMRQAIDYYYDDQGKYPETLEELVEARYLRALPVDPFTKASDSWTVILNDDPESGGIWNVHSGADGTTTAGVAFGDL